MLARKFNYDLSTTPTQWRMVRGWLPGPQIPRVKVHPFDSGLFLVLITASTSELHFLHRGLDMKVVNMLILLRMAQEGNSSNPYFHEGTILLNP